MDAGELDGIPAAHSMVPESLYDIALAIGTGGDAEEPKSSRGITLYVPDDIIVCTFVKCPYKHIGTGFHKPPFEVSSDGRRNIIGHQYVHDGAWGCKGWLSGFSLKFKSLNKFFKSSGAR